MKTSQWFGVMVGCAFAAAISYFQIGSAWADAHKFNGLLGWLGIGIVFSVGALYSLYKVSGANPGKDQPK